MTWRFCFVILSTFLSVHVTVGQVPTRPIYSILFDTTGSMRSQLNVEVEVGREIVKQVRDEAIISTFVFASDPSPKYPIARPVVDVECSNDRTLINQQIDNLFIVSGQTTLLDAVKKMAERLGCDKPEKCGELSDRNIILISDGEDRVSVTKIDDLLSLLKRERVKVYAVGLLDQFGFQPVSRHFAAKKGEEFSRTHY